MAAKTAVRSRESAMPLSTTDPDEETSEEEFPRSMQCGIGSWRPACLQRCANVKAFTATLSFWSLFGNMNFSYYTAVIVQIEREFGLSSSLTGFVKNVDNIGYMLTVVLLSHFFRYGNKPRLFASATLLSSSAIFLFATPHFFFGGRSIPASLISASANRTAASAQSLTELCSGVTDKATETVCGGVGSLRAFNAAALGIFILSELLQGVGQSPKFTLSMTYLDDNAKDNSPKYFAYMFSMRAFSPVMGFLLGAWTSSIYVDLSDPGFGQLDPRWVGAWWLGFVICAACSIVWAIPMLFFPPVLRDSKFKDENDALGGKTIKEMVKDLPLALGRLVKNKLYVTVIFAICVEIYMVGFMTFLPKYFQFQFGITASVASILTAVIGGCSWAVGPIISGMIVTRMKKITPFTAMRVVVILTCITVGGYFIMMFLGCPEEKWAGELDRDGHKLMMACNSNCSCESARYQPICGDDNINYFSPCQAGCLEEIERENGTNKKVYTGCQCIPSGRAVDGNCPKQCNMVVPYSIVLFITTFISSMDIIPTMTIFMRCVDSKDKATALAIATAIMQVVAFPAPMVAGLVIDSACLIQQESVCTSRKGACLYYDPVSFRYRMNGFVVAIKALACLLYFLALWFSRNAQYADEEIERDEKEQQQRQEEAEMLDATGEGGDSAKIKEKLSQV